MNLEGAMEKSFALIEIIIMETCIPQGGKVLDVLAQTNKRIKRSWSYYIV